MTSRTPRKICLALTALFFVSACGVKGPPLPPLENEASVKKTPDPSVNATSDKTSNETPAAPPVIFPPKKTPAKKGDKQGQ